MAVYAQQYAHARKRARAHYCYRSTRNCSGRLLTSANCFQPITDIEMLQKAREYLLTLHGNAIFAIYTLQNSQNLHFYSKKFANIKKK